MHRRVPPDVHRLALWADQLSTAGAMNGSSRACGFGLFAIFHLATAH
jgi:hypothetical protein